MARAPATSSSTGMDMLDNYNDGLMAHHPDGQNHDYAFANFDISDYVSSNGDQLDIFTDPNGAQQAAAHGHTVAMMTEALAHQLQESHPSGSPLMNPSHQQMNQQQHNGLSTPMSLMRGDASSSSPSNPGTSSGHMTPIGGSNAGPRLGDHNTTELLKEQLSKQIRLQQLQHLQNQLLQQQIDLISGGNSPNPMDASRLGYGGLLTPDASSEMRPMPQPDFVSPMLMQQQSSLYATPQEMSNAFYSLVNPNGVPVQQRSSQPNQAMTAPASLVFHNAVPQRVGNMDYFSPLTSPALGPSDNYGDNRYSFDPSLPPAGSEASSSGGSQAGSSQQPKGRPRPKRRSSVDEPLARKRQSPLFPPNQAKRQQNKESPALGAQRGRRSRAATLVSPAGRSDGSGHPQNTPSPVDLDSSAMPPPAPPHTQYNDDSMSMNMKTTPPPGYPAPVTPGSIMNLSSLSRLSTGLVSRGDQQPSPVSPMMDSSRGGSGSGSVTPIAETESRVPTASELQAKLPSPKKDAGNAKGRPPARSGKASTSSATGMMTPYMAPSSSTPKVGATNARATRSMISPNLKPILPGGIPGDAVAHLSMKSNYQNILEGRGKDLGISFASESHTGVAVKKTSHKAAEQKRRDSLKSGFDDLRILLPPITYDPDAGEERPAGSLPPRGPPRNMPGVAEEHPNRGVSKLALLRSANEHIVRLNRRVERRNDMIDKMRRELEALRLEVGVGTVPEEQDEGLEEEDAQVGMLWKDLRLVDLTADLDAVEKDDEEEKATRLLARPSETLARQAALQQGISSSSST